MDNYTSEQEQIDQLKRWWNNNGRSLLAGLIIGLGGLGAYRYWDTTQESRALEASVNYEHFLTMLSTKADDDAVNTGRTIVESYPGSIYARLTTLLLARVAVDKGDYPRAKEYLRSLIDEKDSGELANIARARLARVLLAEGAVDEAEVMLAAIPAIDGVSRFTELRGDVLAARGDLPGARSKYLEALVEAEKTGGSNELLQLKLDNLTVTPKDDGS